MALSSSDIAHIFSSSVLPLWLKSAGCCVPDINRVKTLLCYGAGPAVIWNLLSLRDRRWFCERTGQPAAYRQSWATVEPRAARTIFMWAAAHVAEELRLGRSTASFSKGAEQRT